jgi:hypothetical protein
MNIKVAPPSPRDPKEVILDAAYRILGIVTVMPEYENYTDEEAIEYLKNACDANTCDYFMGVARKLKDFASEHDVREIAKYICNFPQALPQFENLGPV